MAASNIYPACSRSSAQHIARQWPLSIFGGVSGLYICSGEAESASRLQLNRNTSNEAGALARWRNAIK